MADRITFDDKADLITTTAARINKSTAADWNDVKTVVNSHATDIENIGTDTPSWSGWASYVDTQYPDDQNVFTLAADTDTIFPNNSGTVVDSQKPTDITSFVTVVDLGAYSHSKINGRNGDGIDIMLYFKAIPSAQNQWLDIWIDIGGSVGELYRQAFAFPRGSGVERGILYALPSAYTLGTWEANGGTIYVRSNASTSIYKPNLNIDRTHKAR